ITALQMATASLATPKSVMKTIVGCGAEESPPPTPGVTEPERPHPAARKSAEARTSTNRKSRTRTSFPGMNCRTLCKAHFCFSGIIHDAFSLLRLVLLCGKKKRRELKNWSNEVG